MKSLRDRAPKERDSMNVAMRRPSTAGVVKRPALLVALSIVCGIVALETAPQTPPPRDAPRPAQASTARIRGRIVALDTGNPSVAPRSRSAALPYPRRAAR
jgi:hypothetical protein